MSKNDKKKQPDYIISSSEKRGGIIYIRDIILTALVWVLYFYFMRDFFWFCGDFFSWSMGGFVDTDLYPRLKILGTIAGYFEALVIMTVLFIGWSVYNVIRYGKKKRRKTSGDLTDKETAEYFHVKQVDLKAWQNSHIMVVHHDGRGAITDVVIEK